MTDLAHPSRPASFSCELQTHLNHFPSKPSRRSWFLQSRETLVFRVNRTRWPPLLLAARIRHCRTRWKLVPSPSSSSLRQSRVSCRIQKKLRSGLLLIHRSWRALLDCGPTREAVRFQHGKWRSFGTHVNPADDQLANRYIDWREVGTYVGLGGFPEPDAASAAMTPFESCEFL